MNDSFARLAEVPEFVFALVLMLGVVITVHEFGHFIVAKLAGVRVLKFSIGFGPPIGFGRFRLAWHRGGTDYVIAWLPLGGFVKMLGENPDEIGSPEARAAQGETLQAQPTWKKLAIIFAGPAMNLVLPVVVLTGSLMVGVGRDDAVVGTVERGSPAAAAGIESGDRVLSVDGEPVRFWHEVEDALRARPGESIALALERDGAPLDVAVTLRERAGLDLFRTASDVGWLGVQHTRQRAVLGVPSGDSPAARAGLRSGDRVVAVAGSAVEDWVGWREAYRQAGPGSVRLEIARPLAAAQVSPPARGEPAPAREEERIELEVPATGSLEALGVIPAVVLVAGVEADSPAAEAGVRVGDVIFQVDGEPVGSWFTFQETVLASQGRALAVMVARDGEALEFSLRPRLMDTELEGGSEELYRIGISGHSLILEGARTEERIANPLVAVPRAAGMTVEITGVFLRGLRKLVTGEISRKNVGGPIEIARQSHLALERGWDVFLRLLILISINVGILNLLPIPILDGGQALLFTVEGVMRAPLSIRTREIVQQIGVVFLIMLMGLAFWNDFTRNWSNFVEWIQGL